jgi:hypothetical protein
MGLDRMLRRLIGQPDRRHGGGPLPLAEAGFPIALSCPLDGACTAALEWFLHHCGRLDEVRAGGTTAEEFVARRLLPTRRHARLCARLLARRDCHVVKIVRNPYRRAVELHLLSITPGPVTAGHDDRARRRAADLRRWRARMAAGRDTDSSLREFLLFVAEQRRRLLPLDPHVAPQYDPTLDPRVDEVIAAEDLAAGLVALEDRFGLPRSPLARFAGRSRPQPIEACLDRQTRALVRLAYDCDCFAYGDLYGVVPAAAADHDQPRTSLWADMLTPSRRAFARAAPRLRAA